MMGKHYVQVTGLWINTSASGATYISGYLGSARILIFANTFRSDDPRDDHPAYIMYVAPPDDRNISNGASPSSPDRDDIPW